MLFQGSQSSTNLVVCNKLCLHVARDLVDTTQHLACLQPPDGAGGVDAAGADQVGVHLVPVERRQRRTEV